MRLNLINCILIGLLLLGGCREKILNKAPDYEGDKLVIYSELNPDSLISLSLSKSYPVVGNYNFDKDIKNATITLFEDSLLIGQMYYQSAGLYKSTFYPKIGHTYYFRVKVPGFPDAYSLPVNVPQPAKDIGVLIGDTVLSEFGNKAREITVHWRDNDESNNTFLITINGLFKNKKLAINTFSIGGNSEVETACGYYRDTNLYIYKDFCLSDKTGTAHLSAELYGFLQEPSPDGIRKNVDGFLVSFYTISDSYEKYLATANVADELLQAFQPPAAPLLKCHFRKPPQLA